VIVASAVLTGPAELFAQCGDPDAGDCCEANFTPGCVDAECCELICQFVPSCCNIGWSSSCAFLAMNHCVELCGGCGSGGAGPCCSPNDTPYCSDESCCDSVCAVLPHCCETEWDEPCAELALTLCADLPECQPPSCTPFCDKPECCNSVCAVDPYCCEIEWDDCCAEQALDICGAEGCELPTCDGFCGGQSPGGCWCDNACANFGDCCNDVCDICCHHNLDFCANCSTCVNFCGEESEICSCDADCHLRGDCCSDLCERCPDHRSCPKPNPADLNDDGIVTTRDLLVLLGAWGPCPRVCCPADLNGDATVDGADLLILLNAWG